MNPDQHLDWKPREDRLVRKFPPEKAAKFLGRTLQAVQARRTFLESSSSTMTSPQDRSAAQDASARAPLESRADEKPLVNTRAAMDKLLADNQDSSSTSRHRKLWSPAEDELVRTLDPDEVAKRTGRSLPGVLQRRQKLGLPDRRTTAERTKVGRSKWTPEADAIVREHPPAKAARLLGTSDRTVRVRRQALGLPRYVKPPKPPKRPPRGPRWTAEEEEIVRTMTAKAAQAMLPHRSRQAINFKRVMFKKAGVKLPKRGAAQNQK